MQAVPQAPRRQTMRALGSVAAACLFFGAPLASAELPAERAQSASQTELIYRPLNPPALLERRLEVEARLAGAGHLWLQTGATFSAARLTSGTGALDGRFHLLAEHLQAEAMSMKQIRKADRLEHWHGLRRYAVPAFDAASDLLILWDMVDEDDEPSRATLRWTPRLVGAGATLEITF